MSDNKHVQNDALWNKMSPASVAAAGVSARLPYNPTMGGSGSVLFSGPPTPVSNTNHAELSFSAARFQAPSIHQQQHLASSPTMAAASLTHTMATAPAVNFAHHHHHTAPSIASSNVPVYPPTAAATSVLTPNPFAAVAGATTATTPAALQQLFHAMNSAAVASLASSTAMGSPLSLNTQTSPQIAAVSSPSLHTTHGNRTAVIAPDLPSPSSNSSASVVPTTSGFLGGGGGSSGGAITSTITENVLNAISGISQNATPSRNMGFGVKSAPDEEKLRRVHQMVEASIGDHAKQQIVQILDCISTLKPVEKLLLYLRLPGAAPETDPLRQPQNPLGTRSEINHTINWVRSHLEQDPNVSIPKQDVYNDYIAYCERLDIKPLSTADFGKVMKQVFPGIRPRRLGTRGHSRYCYAAMRKSAKLASPKLPQLGTGAVKSADSSGADEFSTHSAELGEQNSETWSVIKSWAENMLQVKIENAKDLAELIKTGIIQGTAGNASSGTAGRTSITHKKFGNRETKEKRLLTDMGPIKKRRKKKRKGSSSSESSYNSQPPIKLKSSEKEPVQTKETETGTANPTQSEPIAATSDHHRQINVNIDKDESMQLIQVKEEFIDIPNNQRIQHLSPPSRHVGALGDIYMQQQQQQLQPQTLPINLAPEQRTVLASAPATANAYNSVPRLHTTHAAAAKNLVPKIMELAAANANSSQASFSQVNQANAIVPIIKEEEADEYNTSNILCKKVRKAQQTKGVWQPTSANVTTSNQATGVTASATHIVPVIRTSAATPTPQQDAQIAPTANTPSPNYLMGPPAAASSTSPFAATDNTGGGSGGGSHLTPVPKVASRNMAQLRAKRLQLAAAVAAAAAAADANTSDDLPESLGLPRERVISICNMDKHELDDYFINSEEEEDNSNEPDTELLQYFQTGDAEEKLNSSDAGKQRNPTAAATTATGSTVILQQRATQAAVNETATSVAAIVQVGSHLASASIANVLHSTTTTTIAPITSNTIVVNTATLTKTTTTKTAPVGSASASLAFMSQKHQQQQQQHQMLQKQQSQPKQIQQQQTTAIATKRKIPPSGPTIKHCTFAPISPNINNNASTTVSSTSNGAGSAPLARASTSNGATNAGLFASPGLTPPTRLRPKPSFGKQQSLDIDLSSSLSFPASRALSSMHDPMIGATRRRRNYATNVTSASAPPSPSLLHQQQQQQLYSAQHFQNTANQWQTLLSTTAAVQSTTANAASFLNDQNSLDLDLFGAANTNATAHANNNVGHYGAGIDVAGGLSFDDYVTETQRSQSVPLSQLQRIHSPPALHKNVINQNRNIAEFNVVAENSLLCSENSSSQHSNSANSAALAANCIKLEDAATATADVITATDSAALLDCVDVSEILSSPEFVQNFTSIAQQKGNNNNGGSNITAATTTCSSAGSSSGYSSGACTTFSGNSNIMSRSVPSTPLPHHHQNLFGQSSINLYNQRRRSGFVNDELQLSPGVNGFLNNNKFNNANNNNSNNNNNNNNNSISGNISLSFGNTFGSRSIYDISKSMPTTPITTPCFRYSPEFNRDFLINGNTIDDSISFGAVGGSDSLMSGVGGVGSSATSSNVIATGAHGDENVNLVSNLNADALLSADDVSVPCTDDVLLGNL